MKKSTEYTRRWRERNPIRNLYQRIKHNAKSRKILFTLTYTYFHQWCLDTHYHELVGRDANAATIDRIKAELGYADGNIQILSNRNNVIKQHSDRCKVWYSVEGDDPHFTINPF